MLINPSYTLFYFTLISSTLISISSSTWLGMWMGLEMNLLSFIPLMMKNKTPQESEACMKYFLVQAIASVIFIMAVLLSSTMDTNMNNQASYLIWFSLLMKMGSAPFHFWFPGVLEGINWINCLVLMTWQKLAPFALISYKMVVNMFCMLAILSSVIIGALGGLNQNSLRKMMAYSSISHLGWMLSAMMISKLYWMMYFLIYMLMNSALIYIFNKQSLFYMSQSYSFKNKPLIKFAMMISMLSLAGLPPFLGFFPKWLIIQYMISQNLYLMILIMVMTTLLTLFFYLRVMISSFLINNQELLWDNMNNMESYLLMNISLSIMGIPMMLWMSMY